jgi:hypothetical protein
MQTSAVIFFQGFCRKQTHFLGIDEKHANAPVFLVRATALKKKYNKLLQIG